MRVFQAPEKDAFDKASLAINVVLGVVGVSGIMVGIWTLIKLERQTKAAEGALISAKDSANAALLNAQAVMNAERAWIFADLGLYGESVSIIEAEGFFRGDRPFEATEIMNVKLTCKNENSSHICLCGFARLPETRFDCGFHLWHFRGGGVYEMSSRERPPRG